MAKRKVSAFVRDAALCRLMSGYGVTVVIKGDACPQTNGKVIVLPPLALRADDIDVAIHEFGVCHEPSHITEDSFDPSVKVPGFLHSIHNFLEDIRCEDSQERTKYPGLRRERAHFYGDFSKYAPRMGTAKLIVAVRSRADVIRGGLCLLLLEARCQQLGVKHNMVPSSAVLRFYRTTLAPFLERAVKIRDVHETALLAAEIHKAIYGALTGVEDDKDKDGGLFPKRSGDSPFAEVSDPTPPKDTFETLEDEGALSVSDHVVAIMTAGGKGTADLIGEQLLKADPLKALSVTTLRTHGIALLGAKGATMTRLLVANSRPRTVRGRRDGRLDCRAVAGDHWDTRTDLYTRRIKGSVDKAAVMFLLDASGSMEKRAYTQYAAMHGIAHYLEKARVPFEVAAFNDYYYPIKKFAEPCKGDAFNRMYSFASGNTNLAGALRKASRVLMARPERRKVLCVMSDGSAKDLGYCTTVTGAMRREGATVIGVGLCCDLSGIFGDDSINLPVEDMGPYLVKRLTEILSRKAAA